MDKKPVAFEEWLSTSGETHELASKILLTHVILRDNNTKVIDRAYATLIDSFKRALSDSGYKPKAIEFYPENDAMMGAKEITALIETYQGASLEEYANMSFAQAKFFYEQVRAWENKSLWQYLKWWVKRRF